MKNQTVRYETLRASGLLERPDAIDLIGVAGGRRGYRYVTCGDVLRRGQIKQQLEQAYLGYRMLDAGRAVSSVVSKRTTPIRIMRRTA